MQNPATLQALCAAAAVGLLASVAGAQVPVVVTAPLNGAGGTDFNVYEQTGPGTLTLNNGLNTPVGLTATVAGNSALPGGAVELAPAVEDAYPLAAFAAAPTTSLSGTVSGHAVTIRSLNGADWYTDPSNPAAGGLADQWAAPIVTYLVPRFMQDLGYSQAQATATAQQIAFGSAQDGGLQRVSDPNVAYAYLDAPANELVIGLIGTSSHVKEALNAAFDRAAENGQPLPPALVSYINSLELRGSEAVAVQIDGGPTQYLFTTPTGPQSTPSGLELSGDPEQFTRIYEVRAQVPEPGGLALLLTGGAALLRRNRRAAGASPRSLKGTVSDRA